MSTAPIWAEMQVWPRDYNVLPPIAALVKIKCNANETAKAQPSLVNSSRLIRRSLCLFRQPPREVRLPQGRAGATVSLGFQGRHSSNPGPLAAWGFVSSTVTRNSDPLHRFPAQPSPARRPAGRGIVLALPRASRMICRTPSGSFVEGTTPPCGRATPDTLQRCRVKSASSIVTFPSQTCDLSHCS